MCTTYCVSETVFHRISDVIIEQVVQPARATVEMYVYTTDVWRTSRCVDSWLSAVTHSWKKTYQRLTI